MWQKYVLRLDIKCEKINKSSTSATSMKIFCYTFKIMLDLKIIVQDSFVTDIVSSTDSFVRDAPRPTSHLSIKAADWLIVCLRRSVREFFTHMELAPLSVKSSEIRPLLGRLRREGTSQCCRCCYSVFAVSSDSPPHLAAMSLCDKQVVLRALFGPSG